MLNRKIVFPIISIILLVVALTITNTEEVLHNFSRFPVWLIFLVLGLLGINLGVVTYRLKQVLIHFGIAAPAWVVLKANISGYVASLFFISLFGQVAGRHLVLSKFGVPPSILAFLTAYERIVLFIISGSLCLLGAVFILDSLTISKFLTNISIVEIVITASGGLILSLWLSRSKFESFLVKRTKSLKNIINVSEVIAITLIAQLLIFTTFIIGVLVLQPNVDFWELLAAVAITSFAASLPLSVNGWGVRELAAVYALGKIGVSSPNALAVSILVGLCSTAIILIAAPIALKKQVNGCLKKPLIIITESIDAIQIEKAAVWLIVTATAVLLFFQIHLTLAGGIINVNLADPFAILALSVTVLHIISTRQFPNWRIFQFNKILISISALFIFSFFNGVVEIGITQWALVGRLFGWLVLLGYLSVGYLTVHYLGGHGLRRLSETIVSTAVAVIVVQISLRFLDKSGWLTGLYISPNFQGFAGNRNAFAFQMLICLILMLAYSTVYRRADRFDANQISSTFLFRQFKKISFINVEHIGVRQILFSFLTGFILISLVISASRAGLITGGLLLLMAIVMNIADRRFIILSMFFAVLIWYLPQFFNFLIDFSATSTNILISKFSSDSSNVERWLSISKGIDMWLDSPLYGSGLGVFIETSTNWNDEPLVIHNTFVWILAELGLLGAGIFLSALAFFIHFLYKNKWTSTAHRIFALLIFAFVVFSLVHEIFYQRMFWLILGLVLAVPMYKNNNDCSKI